MIETSIENFSQIIIIQIWGKGGWKENAKKMQKTFPR